MANLRSLIGSVSPNDIAPMSRDCTMTQDLTVTVIVTRPMATLVSYTGVCPKKQTVLK